MNNGSEALILRILKWFCPNHLFEEISGDILQRYHRDLAKVGEEEARRKLIFNCIRFFRPGIIMRNKFNYTPNRNLMLKTNTRLIIRQANRNKIFTAINLLGLTVSITVCLLIAQFVLFEHSFERFNKNADRTFRINLYNTQNGVFTGISKGTVPALAYSIRQSIPGIESIARVSSYARGVVSNRDRQLEDLEDRIVFADPSVIEVLSLAFVDGDKAKALHDTKSVIISESLALKYFGSTSVSGKVLEFGFSNNSLESTPYQIQGVFKDIPANTHKQFDIVMPPSNEQAWNENWSWSDVTTYVVLSPNANKNAIESGFAQIVKQHHQDGAGDRYLLEPITSIRLHALDGSGRASLVGFFIVMGVVILLLSWFNYTNLSTARFLERMKEVGIRKLIGASRLQLIIQFLTECFLFNLVSFSLAVFFFFIGWPYATTYLDQNITITLFNDVRIYAVIAAFIGVSTLLSGLYPSIFLSSFKPVSSLKGLVTAVVDRSTLRRVIVVVQLAVSVVLVTAVIAIRGQIEFMRTQDLGISIDQTVIIEEALVTDATSIQKYETVKAEMLKLTSVEGVTNASSFPGKEIDWHRSDITLNEENAAYKYDSRIISIGTEFLDLFGVGLVAGRNFDPAIESDKKGMLISEEASRMFGFPNYDNALGKIIFIGSRRFEVIGVVKNYHYRALQSTIEPLLYMQSYPRGPAFAIKIQAAQIEETIPLLKSIWEDAYSGNVFRYYFLDDFFDSQYRSETQIGNVVTTLTMLAIVIACSGLFALSLYSVGRRSKEISIRKVFGATISNVVVLLSRDLVRLMIIAGVLTIPFSYFAVNRWLGSYAYKMPLNPWMFLLPLLSIMTLVMITIGFQTISAARRNPVSNLKHE